MTEFVPFRLIVDTAPTSSADSKPESSMEEPFVTRSVVFDPLPPSCMFPPVRIDDESTVTLNVPFVTTRSFVPIVARLEPESTRIDPAVLPVPEQNRRP